MREDLAKNNTVMVPQPPRSPELAPCDFSVVKIEEAYERSTLYHHCEDKDGMEGGAEQDDKKDFFRCFEDWKKTLA